MMAGNPNWWSMMINNGMHPQAAAASPASQFVYGGGAAPNLSSFPSSNSGPDLHHQPSQDFPVRSWSQLLLGGLSGGTAAERYSESLFQEKKMQVEDWEEDQEEDEASHGHHPHQALNLNPPTSHFMADQDHHHHHHRHHPVKQEFTHQFSNSYDSSTNGTSWPSHHVSSPNSCTTSLSNSFLNFSTKPAPPTPAPPLGKRHHTQDHSSECNSSSSGGASKKARVHHSLAQPALKVRKEKLGDRITALHQLVSPFGKTDTASVLSEAIGYIRFLQGQIEDLSSPYMRSASGSETVPHLHSGSEGPGAKNLRSRGLCLVPISCTQNVAGVDCGGADYWAPAAYGGASAF